MSPGALEMRTDDCENVKVCDGKLSGFWIERYRKGGVAAHAIRLPNGKLHLNSLGKPRTFVLERDAEDYALSNIFELVREGEP